MFSCSISDLTQNSISQLPRNCFGLQKQEKSFCQIPNFNKMRFSRHNENKKVASKNHTPSQTRMHKPCPFLNEIGQNLYPVQTNLSRNHTLWCRTHLSSLSKGVPHPPFTLPATPPGNEGR